MSSLRHTFSAPLLAFGISLICSITCRGQSMTADALFEKGQQEYASGNYDEAIALFNQCLDKKPSFTEAYVSRASSKEQLKDFPGALTDYSIASELNPESFDALLGRANVFYKLERYKEAKSDYLRLLDFNQGETSTVYFQKSASPTGTMQITTAQSDFNSVIFSHIGLSEMKLHNFQEAIKWLDSAIHRKPREADYYVNRGLAKQQLKDETARQDFEKALEINPHHTSALAALASLRADGKRSEEYLQQAIESDSTALHPFLERAYQRMESGNYAGALEDYDHALTIENKDPEIWLNSGFVREKLNDLEGAYDDYTKAISLKEDYSQAWLNRGNVLQRQKKLQEAMEDYSIAITYDPQYGAAFYNRAIVRERLKMKSESCADVRKAEQLGMTVDPKLKAAVCK